MALTFLILGCGWVGEAFGKEMRKRGHQVYATTTRTDKCHRLNDDGIYAFIMDFENPATLTDLPTRFDYVVTSVPAVRSLDSIRVQRRFENITRFLGTIGFRKNIFLSSIGIYPDISGEFTEEAIVSGTSNLAIAERYILNNDRTTVYRLGGLFGANRVFAKYFQDRCCTTGDQKANFIHLFDLIELMYLGFTHLLKERLYNIVAPEHPIKRDVILASANKYGFNLPSSFEDSDSYQKIVRGDKITKELQYTFLLPSPLLF